MDAASSVGPSAPAAAPALLELVTAVGLLELELWYLRAQGPAWLNVLVFGAILGVLILSHFRRLRREPAPGATLDAGPAWLESFAACLVLSTTLMVAAALVGDANETFEFLFLDKPPLKLLNWLAGKFGAALGQQLALQYFLWPVCRELTRSRQVGTLLAATVFGLIHLPSPTLVAITTLAGLVWIALYRRSGRLAPLVVSHMILATLAHGGLPERLTYDMRVGSTATADLKRFETLNDPHARLVNRRLKQNRAEQRRFSSPDYYQSQGGTLPSFIRALYRDLLDRPANDADVAFWVGRNLANPRDDLPTILLASDEYAEVKTRRQGQRR